MAKKKTEDPEDRIQVGSVKVVVRDPDEGNRVVRVPVYEGENPEAVAAKARAEAFATRS